MANVSDTKRERDRCLKLIGKILHNPTQPNMTALVLTISAGFDDDFEPPDGTEPSAPVAQQPLEEDVPAECPEEPDAKVDEDVDCDADTPPQRAASPQRTDEQPAEA